MALAAGEKERVCVTGAGGFTASWIVNLLLSNDYLVHGTVRQPGDSKYDHLNKFDKASENLKLFKADLIDYDSLCPAVAGCRGVFHIASPVLVSGASMENPQVEIMEPAVKGTLNVLNACLEAKVKRVVVLSSVAAVFMNPEWPKDQVMDETCWSDPEYIKRKEKWYLLSKTEAEREALEFGKRTGLEIVTVCPALILGPILQPTMNTSSWLLAKLLKGGVAVPDYNYWNVVDARDVAEAVLLAYKKSEAGERYICAAHPISAQDVVDKYMRTAYPNYNYPNNLTYTEEEEHNLSSDKLQRLGWSYRPLVETLVDSIESYQKAGIV